MHADKHACVQLCRHECMHTNIHNAISARLPHVVARTALEEAVAEAATAPSNNGAPKSEEEVIVTSAAAGAATFAKQLAAGDRGRAGRAEPRRAGSNVVQPLNRGKHVCNMCCEPSTSRVPRSHAEAEVVLKAMARDSPCSAVACPARSAIPTMVGGALRSCALSPHEGCVVKALRHN